MSILSKLSTALQVRIGGTASAAAPLAASTVRPSSGPDHDPTPAALHINCPNPTAEDNARQFHIARGQKLARQEQWRDLAALIAAEDTALRLTPGGMPVADLLSYGARADVVLAVEHALISGRPEKDAPLLDGIEALEHVLAEYDNHFVIAAIVAQAHIDIGWAWRGDGWDVEIPRRNREAFQAHFDRAGSIMGGLSQIHRDSALVAATTCALLGGTRAQERFVADSYAHLIDLAPANPRPMRALGNHLLPRWFGSYEELELEARRTASRTMDVWGAGGYTWVMFDAIALDDEACGRLDIDFFIEGLRDILDRHDDPYIVNLLAAFCANSIGQSYSGNDQADANRTAIAACARWIVRAHLTELHPMIWAHAARGFDNNLRVHSASRFAAAGLEDATRIITGFFSREIAAGKQIVFTDDGAVPGGL